MTRELACPIEFIPKADDISKYRCACGWPQTACLKMYPALRPSVLLSGPTGSDVPPTWRAP